MIDTRRTTDTETDPIWLNWELIEQRCAEMGAVTSTERAELLGVGRPSLYRWRAGQQDIGLGRAAQIAGRLGLTLADIVLADPKPPSPPPPGPKPPAGPANPRPPAGPKERS